MRIKVKLVPGSSKEEIIELKKGEFKVWLKEKPVDNKANEKLVKVLKKYFNQGVVIKSGFTSRNKTLEILE